MSTRGHAPVPAHERRRPGPASGPATTSRKAAATNAIDASPRQRMQGALCRKLGLHRERGHESIGPDFRPRNPDTTPRRSGVAQRILTPDLPAVDPPGVDVDEFHRNFLLTLKWQLIASHRKVSPEMALVDQTLMHIGRGVTRAHLQALVAKVSLTTPGAAPAQGVQAQPLNPGETGALQTLLGLAATLATQVAGNAVVLAQVFGARAAEAAARLQGIDGHLRNQWAAHLDTHATIDRSGHASHAAFNLGAGADSRLTVTPAFATRPQAEVLRTLIHEASHGACGTLDIAYMNAPYFMRLTDTLAFNNADSFAYAALLHEGGAALVPQGGAVALTRTQAFERAANLCHFKCLRVWPVLKYLLDMYSGVARFVYDDTFDTHEQGMRLGGLTDNSSWWTRAGRRVMAPQHRAGSALRADLLPICRERTKMFEEIVDWVARYVSRPRQIVEVDGEVEMQPVGGGDWPVLRYPVDAAEDPESIARRIFVMTLQHHSFSQQQAEQMFDWKQALFDNLMKDPTHRAQYNVDDNLLALQRILLT